jgi:hypothetical protein
MRFQTTQRKVSVHAVGIAAAVRLRTPSAA